MRDTILHLLPSFIDHSGPARALEIYFNYGLKNYNHICVEIYNESQKSKKFVNYSLVNNKFFFNIIYIIKFFYILNKINPAIIHAHLPQANILSRLGKIFFPKIKLINTYRVSERENDNFGIYSKVYRILFTLTNNIVDVHLAISRRIFDELHNNYYIDKNKIEYVVNSSDYLDNIKINYKPKEDGYLSLISIGTLSKRKNYNALIELIKNNNKIKLYIYGLGEEKKKLEEKIHTNKLENRIFLMGFNENITTELMNYDCYITISKGEGISRALLESLQIGLPLISTDVSGVDECIKVGYNGYILKNLDSNELNKYLNNLQSIETREQFGTYSKKKYRNHTPEKHILHINKIYHNLIKLSK